MSSPTGRLYNLGPERQYLSRQRRPGRPVRIIDLDFAEVELRILAHLESKGTPPKLE